LLFVLNIINSCFVLLNTGSEETGSQERSDVPYSRSTSQFSQGTSSGVFTSQESEDLGKMPIHRTGSFQRNENFENFEEEKSFEIGMNHGNVPLLSMQSAPEYDVSDEANETFDSENTNSDCNSYRNASRSTQYESESTTHSGGSDKSPKENVSTGSGESSTQTIIDAQDKLNPKSKEAKVRDYYSVTPPSQKDNKDLPFMSFMEESFGFKDESKSCMVQDGVISMSGPEGLQAEGGATGGQSAMQIGGNLPLLLLDEESFSITDNVGKVCNYID